MASPQTENGYTRVANELLEAVIKYNCSGLQKEIMLTVIRFTYGFNKKQASLSVRFIARSTGRSYQKISAGLKDLIRKNVIRVEEVFSFNHQPRVLTLNKNYDEWTFNSTPNGEQSPNGIENSTPNGEQNSTPNGLQINKTIKKTIKKYSADDFETFWKIFPNGELGNKGSKDSAKKQFLKLNPVEVNLETLIAAVNVQAEYKQERKSRGQFFESFPHTERWIKNKRWMDETPVINELEIRMP